MRLILAIVLVSVLALTISAAAYAGWTWDDRKPVSFSTHVVADGDNEGGAWGSLNAKDVPRDPSWGT